MEKHIGVTQNYRKDDKGTKSIGYDTNVQVISNEREIKSAQF